MKKQLIFLLSAFLVFSVAISAQGQNKKPAGEGIEKKVEKMAADLGLNDAEKASVKTLFEKQAEDVKKLKAEVAPNSDDLKMKMKDLRKLHYAELKSTLGDVKFHKIMELRNAHKEKTANNKPE